MAEEKNNYISDGKNIISMADFVNYVNQPQKLVMDGGWVEVEVVGNDCPNCRTKLVVVQYDTGNYLHPAITYGFCPKCGKLFQFQLKTEEKQNESRRKERTIKKH